MLPEITLFSRRTEIKNITPMLKGYHFSLIVYRSDNTSLDVYTNFWLLEIVIRTL